MHDVWKKCPGSVERDIFNNYKIVFFGLSTFLDMGTARQDSRLAL